MNMNNFVSARGPTDIELVETSLIKREDIVDGFDRLVDVYGEQQRRSIEARRVVAGEIVDPSPIRLSSAEELRQRRFTSAMYLVAQVAVIAIAVAGAVMVAAPADIRLPAWLLATGFGAAVVIWLQHRKEQELSPEGLQSLRDWYAFQIDEVDATSRRVLVEARADVYRMAGRADLEARLAQREAVALEGQRLDAQLRRRDEDRRHRWEGIVAEAAPTVEETVVSTVGTVGDTVETVAPTVDSTLALVLKTVVELYDQVDPGNPLIKTALPWSARSTAMSPDAKGRVAVALSRLDPPLIELKNGRYYLNVAHYSGPRRASRVLSAAWD